MVNDTEFLSLQGANLILTHGIAGSGKSTWAQKMIAAKPDSTVSINRDDLRFEVFGEDYFQAPSKPQERIIDRIQTERVVRALREGKIVIVDDTNIKPWVIWRLVSAGLFEVGLDLERIHQKYFDVPLEVIHKQNNKRAKEGGRLTPTPIIEKMYGRGYQEDGQLRRYIITKDGILVDGRIYRTNKEGEPLNV